MDSNESTLNVTIRPQIAHECIDGEVIILNMETGLYHTLNDRAGYIWMKIAQHASPNSIVKEYGGEWGISEDQARAMVGHLLVDLEQQDLVEIRGPRPGWIVHGVMRAARHESEASWPVIETYEDMRDALRLDPIHEVDETGWPTAKRPEPL